MIDIRITCTDVVRQMEKHVTFLVMLQALNAISVRCPLSYFGSVLYILNQNDQYNDLFMVTCN